MEFRGKMIHCDSFMNIILDGATEYFNGQIVANYGQVLVRGNNILYIILNATRKRSS